MKSVFTKSTLLLLAAFAIIAAGPVGADDRTQAPTADEIIAKLLDWLEARHKENELFTYKQLTEMETLDSDGKVEEKDKLLYQSEIIDGYPFERLIQKNDKPLTEDDKEEQKEREEKFRERVKERKEKEKEKDGPKRLREIAARFKFEVVWKETIRGRSAFVISFEPDTSKELPEKEDEDRFANALKGKLWVDEQEFAVVKAKARLMHQINFGLGLLAYFKKVHLEHEWARDSNGRWHSARSKTYMWGRSLVFKPIRFREKSKYFDFKKVN